MNKYKEVLEQLRSDKELMALRNDSDTHDLCKASKIIWSEVLAPMGGGSKFYFSDKGDPRVWNYSDTNPCSSSITVTEFLALWESQNDEGKGEEILVKREILEHHYKNHESRIAFPEQVYNAMQEYADLEIEKFARWVANSSSMPSSPKRIIDAFKKNNIATN